MDGSRSFHVDPRDREAVCKNGPDISEKVLGHAFPHGFLADSPHGVMQIGLEKRIVTRLYYGRLDDRSPDDQIGEGWSTGA